jgi:asparagine synthase (glutamine-hydrolysing)
MSELAERYALSMCGIVGGAGLRHSLGDKRVSELASTLIHRGPDEEGYVNAPGHFLAIRRLSIIDIAHGHQPVFDESGQIQAVFNGQIYNYQKLRTSLEEKGHKFASGSDSEVIPHLYEEYGPSFVSMLEGMFSIALFDSRTNTLSLYRDRLGKKPLLYTLNSQGELFFASEMKTLISLCKFKPSDVSTDALEMYLAFGYIPNPKTIFTSVDKLEPGFMLQYSRGEIRKSRYWVLSKDLNSNSEDANLAILDEKLSFSVQKRLITERPIGAFLSGGIDSSLIVAYMAKFLGSNINTFSIAFDVAKFDESKFAERVAAQFSTNHKTLLVTGKMALEYLDRVFHSYDEPFADSSSIPSYILSDFASQDITVALSGDGGDEGFGGYDRYRYLRQGNSAIPLIRFGQMLFKNNLVSENFTPARFRRTLKNYDFVKTDSDLYEAMMTLIPRQTRAALLNVVSKPTSSAAHTWFDLEFSTMKQYNSSLKANIFDVNHYLPDDLLYKMDIASMANSLEVRSPFLDHELLQFGLSLPDSQRVTKHGKHLLRKLALRELPSEVVNRKKMGFGIPRDSWLRNELSDAVEDVFMSKDAIVRNWLSAKVLEDLYKEFLLGRQNHSVIWNVFALEKWARTWLK